MKITLEIPDYNPETGFKYRWENGFDIETSVDHHVILIKTNTEGLISLANHLLNLAQENVPAGNHLHLDEFNSLESGSVELIIEKK